MSNPYQKFLDLLPKTPEFIGNIISVDHPNYKVLVVDGTGLLLCTSAVKFSVGDRVYIAGTEIKRSAPTGTVGRIEV